MARSEVTYEGEDHAAAKIVAACRRGEAPCVISLPALAAIMLNALFPEMTAHLVAQGERS
jgi:hypothetical protein